MLSLNASLAHLILTGFALGSLFGAAESQSPRLQAGIEPCWCDSVLRRCYFSRKTLTPDQRLDHLQAELDRLRRENPNVPGILRLTSTYLRGCSQWKWENHGRVLSEGEVCAIMNGTDREQAAALLEILKGDGITKVEFVPHPDILEIVPDRAGRLTAG